jgi:signal transduction histidine kinase
MLPSSHAIPMNALKDGALPSPQILADAFSEFISASSVLEASYRDLQREVAHLGAELAQRNADLTQSLAENDRMRGALQQMLDSMPCGVLVLGDDRQIVMINPEGRKLLSLGNAPIRTLRELSVASQVNFEALADKQAEPIESEISVTGVEGLRWLAVRIRSLQTTWTGRAHTAQLASIWILRDITAARQAEQEREAARRATALAEISTILAHEIRNPLASLELFAELLEQDPDERSQWLANLRAGIRTLAGTVNNVLNLNGEGKSHLVPVDLGACVESGVEFVRPVADQAGVVLEFEDSREQLSIFGNEDSIRQIVLNLVRNAICHTPVGGAIAVTARAGKSGERSCAIVTVQDTGCGIPANVREHIFEFGFSGTGETPGLGLTVCKRLMTQMNGTIRVESEIQQGTTFYLEFPIL